MGLESYIPEKVKLVHTPHLLAAEKAHYNKLLFPSCIKAAEQALLRRANHIIVLSKSEEAAVCKKYGCSKQKITLAPNGISSAFFKIPLWDEKTLKLLPILFVGRCCRQKGIDVLLDATKRIIKLGVPISLRLVGGPYGETQFDKFIETRVRKLSLGAIVEQVGEVSHDRIPSIMNGSFIYVQPSRYESQGIALLEAMAAGRVVVASDLPAIREYIRHGENGFLVDPENPHALADTLKTLLVNPRKSLPLAYAARNTAKSYTWQRMLKTILPLFNSNLE